MLLNNFKTFFQKNKITITLSFVIILLVVTGFFIYQRFTRQEEVLLEDIVLNFDPEGPYTILTPRRDGNALIINIRRIASFGSFAYALTYIDKQGIDRGAGSEESWIDIKDKKSDYEQEILFGTCSKNVCKYDEGVENGTLILRIRKGRQPYRMLTQWHLQRPDLALGELTSGDGHFKYKIDATREELALVGFTIINDLTGVPKLSEKRKVFGKVYSLNVQLAKELMSGQVTIELAEQPPADAKVARYDESQNGWEELETKISGSILSAKSNGAGIYTVLVGKD